MSGFFEYIQDQQARRLTETLAELMERKRIDDITTSEILARSGISRSTFYRKYRDKYDLLNQNYQLLLDQTISRIPDGMSFKRAFFQLYEALRGYPTFFRNALSSNEPNGLRQYIYERVFEMYMTILTEQGLDMSSDYHRLLLTGYVEGALEVTCIWADRGMKEPIDVLFRITFELMPHEFQSVLSLIYM